jgi:hypothetical protein
VTTSYPGAVDNLTNPTPSDTLNSATVPHAAQHANVNDAVEAIQSTLGTNPQGTSSTVKDRIVGIEGAVLNLNLAIDERVPGEAGSNQPSGTVPNGYIWVNTTDNSIKVWNGSTWVDPSNAGSGGGPSWAVASGGTESTITDGGKSWKVHKFTGNGTLTVSQAGQVEVLIVGGGAGGHASFYGNAGDVIRGVFDLPAAAHAITVGVGGNDASGDATGMPSKIGTVLASSVARLAAAPAHATGAAGTSGAASVTGLSSSIDGTARTYAAAGSGAVAANTGNGSVNNVPGSTGVVIVRYQV